MSDISRQGRTERPLKLADFLPYRLNVLAEGVSQGLSRLYAARYGITIAQWRVLATLGEFETMTSAAIAKHSRMHKTKVSRAIAEMDRNALVRRISNEDDMREAFVTLTAKGKDLYGQIAPQAQAYADKLVGRLPKADQAALWRILEKLDENGENPAT